MFNLLYRNHPIAQRLWEFEKLGMEPEEIHKALLNKTDAVIKKNEQIIEMAEDLQQKNKVIQAKTDYIDELLDVIDELKAEKQELMNDLEFYKTAYENQRELIIGMRNELNKHINEHYI